MVGLWLVAEYLWSFLTHIY